MIMFMRKITLFLSIVFFAGIVFAQQPLQSDSVRSFTMNEVVVTANHSLALFSQRSRVVLLLTDEKLVPLPVAGIDEVLKGLSSVDIRQRGGYGVQSDVSIRGGHYEQTLVLLNGVNFSDPQTGHFNLNLPLSFESVGRLEVLYGSYGRSLGANAMSGALNIVATPKDSSFAKVTLMGGQHALFGAGVLLNFAFKPSQHLLAVNRTSSEGYIHNTDFKNLNIFYSGTAVCKKGNFEFQTGFTQRAFGANSFYTAKYPDQYETGKTAIASVRFQSEGRIKLIPLIYGRFNTDRFELFRNFENAPLWYLAHNFHKTHVVGTSVSCVAESAAGRTSLSASYRFEEIFSTVLGDELKNPLSIKGETASYRYAYQRDYFSLLLDHQYLFRRLYVSCGLMALVNSDLEKWKLLPGLDASFMLNENLKLIASVSTSLRMPTFTDLFYKSPVLIGNPSLEHEESLTGETGFKFIDNNMNIQVSTFQRRGRNLIDWIKYPEDSLWRSENITSINYTGFEFLGEFTPNFSALILRSISQLQLSYTYLHVNKLSSGFESAYALDQLKHKAGFSAEFRVFGNFGISFRFSYCDRYGSFMKYVNNLESGFVPYDDFVLADSRLFFKTDNFNVFADVTNLFDVTYYDIANIEPPGRWIRAGFSWQMNLKKSRTNSIH